MQNNKMRFYTRLDSQGRRIPGSGVRRLAMPKTGRWVEDVLDVCCFPFTAVELTVEDVATDNTLTILCDDSAVAVFTFDSGDVTTVAELTAFLNANYSYLGSFSDDGTDITLNLKQEIASTYCADVANITITTSTV